MNLFPVLLAQNDDAAGAIGVLIGLLCNCIIPLALTVLICAGLWKLFEKAGQPGWAGIIPIYNMFVVTTEIARKEVLWFVLLLIPCVNIVAAIIIWIEVAKNFGKDPLYGIGLALLPFIFVPLLGFSDARFQPASPSAPPTY